MFPSGLSACSHALLGILKAGDHVLICDNAYEPVRMFANQVLTRFEVKVEYFHPTQPSDLLAKIGTKTRAVYLESPGSMTFEVQNLPALCAIADHSGALVLMDNTLGDAALFQTLSPRRRHLDPCRDQVYRWSFRRPSGHCYR
ncbi:MULTISPECIES: aminotransferase class I/II-fold pyridoxal phosphate-dependent enzyme [unclassified Bradyrhizobium]